MKKYLFGTLIGVFAFTLVGGAVALANGNGFGFFGGHGFEDKAEILGMTTDELKAELEDKSMPEILDDHGITHEQLHELHHGPMLEEHAASLDMTVEELEAELEDKTFAEILDERGITHEEMHEMHRAQRTEEITEKLQQMVDDGTITEEQMQEKLEFMESHDGRGFGGCHGKRGFGGMHGMFNGDTLSN